MITDMLDTFILSIVQNGAVTIEGSLSLFAYSGETQYHAHIFDKGDEIAVIQGDDLQEAVNKAVAIFDSRFKTTIAAPERFNRHKTMMW